MEDTIIWKAVMILPFPAFVMFFIWDSDMDLGDSTSPESIFSVLRLHYGVRQLTLGTYASRLGTLPSSEGNCRQEDNRIT